MISMGQSFLIAVMVMVLMAVSLIWVSAEQNEDRHKRAVEVGAAMYTTDAGKFQWVNKDMEYVITGARK